MASLQCLSSCFSLTAKLSTLSLNRPSLSSSSSSRTNFRSLGLSNNGFSKGCLSIGRAQGMRRRLSVVCEAAPAVKEYDSAKKRHRQNIKRRIYNRSKKSEFRTRMKKVLVALIKLKKNKQAQPEEILEIEKLIAEAYKAIDKAVKAGAIHRNMGNHRKSRLARNKKMVMIHHGWYVPGAAPAADAANKKLAA